MILCARVLEYTVCWSHPLSNKCYVYYCTFWTLLCISCPWLKFCHISHQNQQQPFSSAGTDGQQSIRSLLFVNNILVQDIFSEDFFDVNGDKTGHFKRCFQMTSMDLGKNKCLKLMLFVALNMVGNCPEVYLKISSGFILSSPELQWLGWRPIHLLVHLHSHHLKIWKLVHDHVMWTWYDNVDMKIW